MKKAEIDRKFDEIVAFAEIERFLDTPVKRYSSGMYVRLAFAVAAHLDPEILLVDEVLAVGDAAFQKKCLGKMGEVAKGGRTVLFVSHQMDMVRALCGKTVILDKGTMTAYGDTEEVIDSYIKTFASAEERNSFAVPVDPSMPIQFISGRVVGQEGVPRVHFDVFDKIIFEFEYAVNSKVEGSVVNFELKRNGSTLFLSFDRDTDPERLKVRKPGIYKSRVELPTPLLKSGLYTMTLRAGVVNFTISQTLEDILCFSVDIISRPSTFLSYAKRRPGLLAMPLPWHSEKATGGVCTDG
jgi:lipopolysaccharide transport system ATP-binding protein